jgi:hypothetical protein
MRERSIWLRGALDEPALKALDAVADKQGSPGGRVNWTDPQVKSAFVPVTRQIKNILPQAMLTRVVWFAKNASANWGVSWHQDRVIAVAARHEAEGFKNWSLKGDIWHCEPPLSILQTMRFVRVHLDDCDATNGAMEFAIGSEDLGNVPTTEAADKAAALPTETCVASRGDIQILPMLVLHRSLPSQSLMPRRALRLDYAATPLPPPLAWLAA